jgi:hypothetical protein
MIDLTYLKLKPRLKIYMRWLQKRVRKKERSLEFV